MKKKTQDLNMSREYRDELKTLAKAERKVITDRARAGRAIHKQIKALERTMRRGDREADKVLRTIEKRRAILEGRLS